MGCKNSKNLDGEVLINKKIEAEQQKEAFNLQKKMELMILGTGDSGKTSKLFLHQYKFFLFSNVLVFNQAIRKQLSNVHNKNLASDAARIKFSETIVSNLLDGVIEVLSAMPPTKGTLNEELQRLSSSSNYGYIPTDLAHKLQSLFADQEFQDAVKSCYSSLQDCWFVFHERFKNEYPKWGGQGWIPSADDCIRSRARTSGVIKEELTVEGLELVIYDVGGQRSERRKWMNMFDQILAFIFVAALSEYDQVLYEDRSKNRLEESLDLFTECVNSQWFSNAQVILFLNKMDLFHEKFITRHIPINVSGKFPSAPTDFDEKAALDWFGNMFRSRNSKKKQLFIHVTTATDPENIRAVFNATRDIILRKNMQNSGFLG